MHYKLQRSFPLVTMGATHGHGATHGKGATDITNNETIPTTTIQTLSTPV
jgi:hypothetical protein